jgi:hypothetical protein
MGNLRMTYAEAQAVSRWDSCMKRGFAEKRVRI